MKIKKILCSNLKANTCFFPNEREVMIKKRLYFGRKRLLLPSIKTKNSLVF